LSNHKPAHSTQHYQAWEPASLQIASAVDSEIIEEQFDDTQITAEQSLELEKLNAREAGFQQGYQEGLAKGIEEGLIQGLQEGQKQAYDDSRPIFLEQKRHIQSLIAHFESDLNHSREAIAADILKLSLEIAQAMIKTSLQIKPELILYLIRHVLHTLPMLELPAFLILHPTDAQLVIKHMGDELTESGWKILEDASMLPGGCKIDTASNEMEASLESRWQQIQQTLNQNTDWLV
jgi:flagellar assembly protein FliH